VTASPEVKLLKSKNLVKLRGEAMRRFLPILICVLSFLLTACSSGGSIDKLNGKWVADATESMKLSGQSLDGNDLTMHIAEAFFSSISLDVDTKTKKMSVSLGEEKGNVPFKVLSDNGKTIVLQIENSKKLIFDFINDELIIMRDDQEPDSVVALKRAKQ